MPRPLSASLADLAQRRRLRAALPALLALALVGAAGCGGDDKPDYCSKRSALETSVKDLPNAVKSGGTGGLETQFQKIESDANAMIEAAKSDFPDETSTLETNVQQLRTAVDGLSENPSAAQLAPLAIDARAVVNAAKALTDATQSACE